jgi:FkbM family methyltransferase
MSDFDGSEKPWLSAKDLREFFRSYAENFEDVILSRVFKDQKTGFYIDAGANDPEMHSVTKHFYDRGWSGVNIEPHQGFYGRLCRDRPRDVNLNVGLANSETTATFHEEKSGKGISSLTTMFAGWNVGCVVEDRLIELTTLAKVCEQYARQPIDFLKIDVEGVERPACEGGNWSKWRPRIVLIEANWPQYFDDWDRWFKDRDYLFAYFDRINRFYVRAEDRDLIPTISMPFNSHDRAIPYQMMRIIDRLESELEELKAARSDLPEPAVPIEPAPASLLFRMKQMTRHFRSESRSA